MAQQLEIVINAQDKTESAFRDASRSIDGLSDRIERMKPTFQSLATIGTVAFGAIAAGALSALKESSQAAADMAIANTTLENSFGSLTRTMTVTTVGVTAHKKELGENSTKLTELKGKLGDYNDSLRVATARVADMTVKMNDNKANTASQTVAFDLAKKKVAELKDEIAKTTIEISKLDSKSGSLAQTTSTIVVGQFEKLKKELGGTSDVLGEVKKRMEEASQAALNLGFDDETAAKSFSKLFQVTKSVVETNKELGIAMDMARARGISLEEATQKLVMVHTGATKALKLEGLAVDDNATALQNITSLSKVYAGQAKAAAETSAVQFQILTEKVNNLKQAIGDGLEPKVRELMARISPLVDKVVEWAQKNPDLIAKLFIMGSAIAGLVAGVGLLGLALPSIITAFSILTGPVGIIIGLIALAVINFERIKAIVLEVGKVLADNGVFIYFHEIWTNITNNFQQNLLPALQQLWVALQPLVPYFVLFAKVLGVSFVVALMAVGKILEGWIFLFTMLLEGAVKLGTYLASTLKNVFDAIGNSVQFVVDKVTNLINSLQSLWSSMSKFGGSAMSSIGGLFGGSQKVNDAIISPSGRVITPANDDFIMATKNPSAFFGGQGGGNYNININGAIFSEEAATTLGNLIVDKFKTASRVGLS